MRTVTARLISRKNSLGRLRVAILCLGLFGATIAVSAEPGETGAETDFPKFVADLWPLAQSRGVSRKTFDDAFKDVTFDPRVVAHTKAQPEFVIPIWQYLATAVYPSRIERGRAKAESERKWLVKARIEYGVDESVIMGIWGMETEYGAFEGSDNVIRALASLAFIHYGGEYIRDQLLSALSILEKGDIGPRAMVGSWAGAMGQTQFMPSSFRDYAVDFDGGGRRDIWNNAADAIGSMANYLAKNGWKRGLPWGFEVKLPADFKLSAKDSTVPAEFSTFAKRGVERADGGAMPSSEEARLLITAGLKAPIFLVTSNFKTIRSYNESDSYALGVALLGDAIEGRPGLKTAWPIHDHPLATDQIRELQARLKKMGYDVGEIDGRAGEILRTAVRLFQEKRGLTPDGYPTLALLKDIESQN
jgi:membrane-bound lytic murein transglycosylase B